MSDLDRLISTVRASEMLRLCLVGALTLVLLVPVLMIGGLVSEREERYRGVIDEVSASWGGDQRLTGPALVLPYTTRETSADDGETVGSLTRYAIFLPEELRIRGDIDMEPLSRGIFEVPVYRLRAAIDGTFDAPDLEALGVDPASVAWSRAVFVLGISDVRAISEASMLTWDGSRHEFLPGTGGFGAVAGIQAPVPIEPGRDGWAFSLALDLNGSQGLYLGPFAKETRVELASDSGNPGFRGNALPSDRTVSGDGFDAVWNVSYLGRNYPQEWTSDADLAQAIEASRFGVELVRGVDQYRMVDRSVKYAALFILLTFATIWLAEVMAGVRIHPIQYLMLGAALCVFYLLELSLAEHLGFALAYTIASVAILAMVSLYARVAFRSSRGGRLVAGSVAGLYAFLYVLLTNEDAALLVGSIGVFVVLAVIMFATRRIDWYAASGTEPTVGS